MWSNRHLSCALCLCFLPALREAFPQQSLQSLVSDLGSILHWYFLWTISDCSWINWLEPVCPPVFMNPCSWHHSGQLLVKTSCRRLSIWTLTCSGFHILPHSRACHTEHRRLRTTMNPLPFVRLCSETRELFPMDELSWKLSYVNIQS